MQLFRLLPLPGRLRRAAACLAVLAALLVAATPAWAGVLVSDASVWAYGDSWTETLSGGSPQYTDVGAGYRYTYSTTPGADGSYSAGLATDTYSQGGISLSNSAEGRLTIGGSNSSTVIAFQGSARSANSNDGVAQTVSGSWSEAYASARLDVTGSQTLTLNLDPTVSVNGSNLSGQTDGYAGAYVELYRWDGDSWTQVYQYANAGSYGNPSFVYDYAGAYAENYDPSRGYSYYDGATSTSIYLTEGIYTFAASYFGGSGIGGYDGYYDDTTGTDYYYYVAGSGTFSDPDASGTTSAALSGVPEPASLTLLGLGAFGMVGYSWRRRRQASAPVGA